MIRKIKSNISKRVETGALQINDDWAGVFIRGDDAMQLWFVLDRYKKLGRVDLSGVINKIMGEIEKATDTGAEK